MVVEAEVVAASEDDADMKIRTARTKTSLSPTEFYLILDLAAGGTSGWFPDNVGGKMWFDGSKSAMRDFAKAQDTWAATWPSSADDRAFRM